MIEPPKDSPESIALRTARKMMSERSVDPQRWDDVLQEALIAWWRTAGKAETNDKAYRNSSMRMAIKTYRSGTKPFTGASSIAMRGHQDVARFPTLCYLGKAFGDDEERMADPGHRIVEPVDPSDHFSEVELTLDVRRAMEKLDSLQFDVTRLYVWHRMTMQEIADSLGFSRQHVTRVWAAAKMILREELSA